MKKNKKHFIVTTPKDIIDEKAKENIQEIFAKYDIKPENQKFIFKLAIFDIAYQCDAVEVVTDEKFYFAPKTYKKLFSNKLIHLNIISSNLEFLTEPKFHSSEAVMKFINELEKTNQTKNYTEAMKEIFTKTKKLTRKK